MWQCHGGMEGELAKEWKQSRRCLYCPIMFKGQRHTNRGLFSIKIEGKYRAYSKKIEGIF